MGLLLTISLAGNILAVQLLRMRFKSRELKKRDIQELSRLKLLTRDLMQAIKLRKQIDAKRDALLLDHVRREIVRKYNRANSVDATFTVSGRN